MKLFLFVLVFLFSVNFVFASSPGYGEFCVVTLEVDEYFGKVPLGSYSRYDYEQRITNVVSGTVISAEMNSTGRFLGYVTKDCSEFVGRHFLGEFNGVYDNEKYVIGKADRLPSKEYVEGDIDKIEYLFKLSDVELTNIPQEMYQEPLPDFVTFNAGCYVEGTFEMTKFRASVDYDERVGYYKVYFDVNKSINVRDECAGRISLAMKKEFSNYEGQYIRANLACGETYDESSSIRKKIYVLDPECFINESLTENVNISWLEIPDLPDDGEEVVESNNEGWWHKLKGFFAWWN